MAKEDTFSFYINHAIKRLRGQLKTTNTVDMIPIFSNTLLDLSAKLAVGQDLGAINAHGTIHPSMKVINHISRYLYIHVQMQRLPRIISYPIKIIQRFLAKGILHIDAIRLLAQKRVENGGTENDFGRNFHV